MHAKPTLVGFRTLLNHTKGLLTVGAGRMMRSLIICLPKLHAAPHVGETCNAGEPPSCRSGETWGAS
jgi:hypothetical protein